MRQPETPSLSMPPSRSRPGAAGNGAAPVLAARTRRLGSSLVRDMLALTERPGIISFCGGLPASETLAGAGPVTAPASAGQYGSTEGEPALRAWVAERLTRQGRPCTPEQVIITSGAQQGLDLCAKLLVDEGTEVLTEDPTYLAALQVLRLFGARIHGLPVSPEGLDTAALGQRMDDTAATLAYLIPSFQNPGAHCYAPDNRRAVARALDAGGLTLVEDGAYAELALDPVDARPVCGFLERAPWIYLGSFSKVLLPGLRLGYLVADERLVPYLVRLKQAADLHSNRIGQHWLIDTLTGGTFERQLTAARALYRERRDAMAAALTRRLGESLSWQLPRGGLFFWARCTQDVDTQALLQQALSAGVAFMPGAPFFVSEGAPANWLRLNFSNPSPEDMNQGLARLARVLEDQPTTHRQEA